MFWLHPRQRCRLNRHKRKSYCDCVRMLTVCSTVLNPLWWIMILGMLIPLSNSWFELMVFCFCLLVPASYFLLMNGPSWFVSTPRLCAAYCRMTSCKAGLGLLPHPVHFPFWLGCLMTTVTAKAPKVMPLLRIISVYSIQAKINWRSERFLGWSWSLALQRRCYLTF